MTTNETPNRLRWIEIDQLHLDPENPRLPEHVQIEGRRDESVLFRYIADSYDPITVARSIASHGYFESEPLIVIGDAPNFTVVEGNRRLVALRGLLTPDLLEESDDYEEWVELAGEAEVSELVPAVVVQSREEVAPLIGYRHISGIQPWEPFARARFVAHLVDDQDLPFADVAELVGVEETQIRSFYRNYSMLQQAENEFGIDSSRARREFGVFTRAMQSASIRTFIDAPPPSQVEAGVWPLPDDARDELDQLLVWVFGDGTGSGRVISESRDLTKLGETIASDDGREVLEETGDLIEAYESSEGPRRRLTRRLNSAQNALRAAAEDFDPSLVDDEIRRLSQRSELHSTSWFLILMKRSASFSPPLRNDGPQLADWAELVMLVEARERVSRATLRRRLALSAASVDEADLDLLVGEVARRAEIAPDAYPYRLGDAGLQRSTDGITVYDFLLIASHDESEFRRMGAFDDANQIFDLIGREALKRLIGSRSKGVRFEWRVLEGGPTGFNEALSWLADLLDIPEGNATRRAQRKDGGVDVVAWRPFRDGRTSYPVVLAQCTLQARYQRKGSDIEVGMWRGWIRFGVDPMTALVIPFVVPLSDDRWSEMRYTVSVILDRLRICELLEGLIDGLAAEVHEWVQAQIPFLMVE